MPKKTNSVLNFEINKFLGTWYEIARLDFSFEKNFDNISAHYRLDKKDNIIVSNSGFNKKNMETSNKQTEI